MKKIFSLLFILSVLVISLSSCTGNTRARVYGGTQMIDVPAGYKVVEATWKEGSSLWYLMEPMEDDYTPKVKVFQESSRLGLVEGTVKFVESR